MLKSLWEFMKKVFDLIAPRRKNYILINEIDEQTFEKIPPAKEVEGMAWIHPLYAYKNPYIKAIVWELKYRNHTFPLEYIGRFLYDEILALIGDITLFEAEVEFLLIPIPVSKERRAERGYNQSEYICRAILEWDTEHRLLYAPQWFLKIKDTATQNKSGRSERIKNLLGCFEASPSVRDTYIILIDDVVTTGSTLAEARATLLEAGARDVSAFTIGH